MEKLPRAALLDRLFIHVLGCEEGGVAMLFGLACPVLFGMTALAVDSAAIYHQQSRMQSVADASALAVAKELHVYRDDLTELRAVGEARIETLLTEVGLVDRPHEASIDINAAENLIVVQLSLVAKALLPVGIWNENPIHVSSRARAYGQSRLCVLALHDNKSDTIKADDNASLNAPDCAVQSNSTDPNGIHLAGGSEIVSTLICSSGGVKGGSFDPEPQTDCTPLEDPLAAREPPPIGGCDYLDRKIEGGNVSIAPGTYCGGLTIGKEAHVTAEPGTYVITDGKLEVKDKSWLLGDYVTFYFDGDDALLNFDKDTTIDLSAPKDGPLAGLLFFESPAAQKGRDFNIKSENARRLLGTIYLPNGKLKIDTKGDVAEESAYTVIVAEQLEVRGANLVINSDYGGTDVPVPEGIGPNSSMVTLDR